MACAFRIAAEVIGLVDVRLVAITCSRSVVIVDGAGDLPGRVLAEAIARAGAVFVSDTRGGG